MSEILLSLCMIVKNEEKVLHRCLENVKGTVDEIVIVDTGSTDRTVEIAEKEGARVFYMEWENDFAKARNTAIEHARGKWILILDADEFLLQEEGKLLRQHIEENPSFDAFFLQCVSYYGLEKKRLGSSVNPSVRVFRNLPGYRYKGRIHEQIADPIFKANPKAKFQFLDIQIKHDGYLLEVVHEKSKSERNIKILEKELEDTPDECFHRYNMAVEYIRIMKYERALEELRKAKNLTDIKKISYGHIIVKREIDCLEYLGRIDEAIKVCEQAITDFPDYPDLYLSKGVFHYLRKEWDQAEVAFLNALEIGEAPLHYSSNQGAGTYYASFFLGKTYEQMNRFDQAISCYMTTLQYKPNSLPPFLRLISLLVRDSSGLSRLLDKIEHLFRIQSPKTWWSIALSFYQLGLFHLVIQVLERYPVPGEKELEKAWLYTRCVLLLSDKKETEEFVQSLDVDPFTEAKLQFYLSLKLNEADRAWEWIKVIEQQEGDKLLLNLYQFIVHDDEQYHIPMELVQVLPNWTWNELSFLYQLAEKEQQPELKIRIKSYWRALIQFTNDAKQKIEGQFALIKALNIRVHQLLLTTEENLRYEAPWNEVKQRLLTLIDELFMGEIL
ncbi:glycosyltransferase [Microaerobacter geothermalis]|uniref:glycosyltransferase family 2 protein n=1 Tax=Microaerobacter geothermalis TaxID=674972 RepID=UPI001F3F691C|nr:glycosyltransferase family 2 protein [Microaerobacter geothermalis]MCF6093305.1 glycosyltransferase [Microaerobacter geothermalis]